MNSPNLRIYGRPYTNPLVKNPTYPTVTEYHQIVEMTAKQRGWQWPVARQSVLFSLKGGTLSCEEDFL